MAWIALDEAKNHLNIPLSSTADDDEVADFLARTEDAARSKLGWVAVPVNPLVEYHDGGRCSIRLEERPIFEIVSVTVAGVTEPEADLDQAAAFGWRLTKIGKRAGLLEHTAAFPSGWVKVTYKPGRDPIHEDIYGGALELLRHLWETQRGNSSAPGRPGVLGDESAAEPLRRMGTSYSLPKRVLELWRDHMQVPVA